jgi:hypothetical protein
MTHDTKLHGTEINYCSSARLEPSIHLGCSSLRDLQVLLQYFGFLFGQVATASSASRYFRLLAQKLASVWNCNLPYSAPYFRFDYLIRKFEIPCYYSNIYLTRCNVTQFILSGNCSTCFGWYTTHPQEGIQLYLQHLVFVTTLLLPAAIAAGRCNCVTNTKYSCLRSWWWMELPPETCRAVSR